MIMSAFTYWPMNHMYLIPCRWSPE